MSKGCRIRPSFSLPFCQKHIHRKKNRQIPLTDASAIFAVRESELVEGLTQKPPLKNLNHRSSEDGLI